MNTKNILKIIALLVGFAFGWAVCSDAYTIRQVRSLNASTSVGAGLGFTTQAQPFYVPGGGLFWTVFLSVNATSRLTWQIEGQMSDGTWIAVAGPYSTSPGVTTPANNNVLMFSFRGPFQDMRVNLTGRQAGSITADIYVEY